MELSRSSELQMPTISKKTGTASGGQMYHRHIENPHSSNMRTTFQQKRSMYGL